MCLSINLSLSTYHYHSYLLLDITLRLVFSSLLYKYEDSTRGIIRSFNLSSRMCLLLRFRKCQRLCTNAPAARYLLIFKEGALASKVQQSTSQVVFPANLWP